MRVVRVGGRKYSDPDILSLIQESGGLVDPRSAVIHQARKLLKTLREFPGVPTDPFERLRILASLKGIKIFPMDVERQRRESRDAVLVPTETGRMLLYNPNRPRTRTLFTLAHEISHTFFPNSDTGARFRAICDPSSREANELERLCDCGAAELVMPLDDFQTRVGLDYSLTAVDEVAADFGTSFEATTFRMASAHPGIAVAGLLKYRHTVGEQRQLSNPSQRTLFKSSTVGVKSSPVRKYRRQSLHLSESAEDHTIRWNKSFDVASVVYQARKKRGVVIGAEVLPNGREETGRLEAIVAPFQREDADAAFPDVIFLWTPLQ